MDDLNVFLRLLLRDGRAVLRQPPGPAGESVSGAAIGELGRAFSIRGLEVAGPPIAFDAAVASAAASLVWRACWALVIRGDRPEDLARDLTMPLDPTTPAHHLSADVALRFLPQVRRRARGVDPADPLASGLADLLRRWPLSGVLDDLDDGPESPPDLGGHRGLMLLYAERLARRDRPAWRPSAEAGGYVERVGRAGDGGRHG